MADHSDRVIFLNEEAVQSIGDHLGNVILALEIPKSYLSTDSRYAIRLLPENARRIAERLRVVANQLDGLDEQAVH